jgi:hypothetical protein
MQPWRRVKCYHLLVNGWNWRTSFWVSLAWPKRPKIVCSPSYVDIPSIINSNDAAPDQKISKFFVPQVEVTRQYCCLLNVRDENYKMGHDETRWKLKAKTMSFSFPGAFKTYTNLWERKTWSFLNTNIQWLGQARVVWVVPEPGCE